MRKKKRRKTTRKSPPSEPAAPFHRKLREIRMRLVAEEEEEEKRRKALCPAGDSPSTSTGRDDPNSLPQPDSPEGGGEVLEGGEISFEAAFSAEAERRLFQEQLEALPPLSYAQIMDAKFDMREAPPLSEARLSEIEKERFRWRALGGKGETPLLGVEPAAARMPRRIRKRIERGTLSIDARIDLHHETRRGGIRRLADFVERQRAQGSRILLVITGRGRHSPERVSVLQEAVIAWVHREGRGRIAHCYLAPPALGGEGALVLFLSTRRSPA